MSCKDGKNKRNPRKWYTLITKENLATNKVGSIKESKGHQFKYLYLKENKLIIDIQMSSMAIATSAINVVIKLSTIELIESLVQQETKVWVHSKFNVITAIIMVIFHKNCKRQGHTKVWRRKEFPIVNESKLPMELCKLENGKVEVNNYDQHLGEGCNMTYLF